MKYRAKRIIGAALAFAMALNMTACGDVDVLSEPDVTGTKPVIATSPTTSEGKQERLSRKRLMMRFYTRSMHLRQVC